MNPPNRALTDHDLAIYAAKIPNFRGVFMRDALPGKPKTNECAILNLDSEDGPGTHWVAYKKIGNFVEYYDSFGKLPPPLELNTYFGKRVKITYNYNTDQNYNSVKCGHLCLKFLNK